LTEIIEEEFREELVCEHCGNSIPLFFKNNPDANAARLYCRDHQALVIIGRDGVNRCWHPVHPKLAKKLIKANNSFNKHIQRRKRIS